MSLPLINIISQLDSLNNSCVNLNRRCLYELIERAMETGEFRKHDEGNRIVLTHEAGGIIFLKVNIEQRIIVNSERLWRILDKQLENIIE